MNFNIKNKISLKYILIFLGVAVFIIGGLIFGYWWLIIKEHKVSSPFKSEVVPKQISECEQIDLAKDVDRTLCFINLGKHGDLGLCDNVQGIREKEYCYGGVAGAKKDITICDSIDLLGGDFLENYASYTPAELAWTIRRNIPSYLVEYYSQTGSTDIVMFLNPPVFGEQEAFAWGMGFALGSPCYVGAAVTQEGLTISELRELSPWSYPTIENVAILLAVIKKEPKICEDTVNFLEKKLPETGYSYIADEIKDDFLFTCYTALAVKTNDIEICKKIPQKLNGTFMGGQDTCIDFVKNPEDINVVSPILSNLCKDFDPQNTYFSPGEVDKILPECLETIKDINDCEKFTGEYRKKCYYSVALNLKDIKICENKLDNQEDKEDCYSSLAKILRDGSVCEKIKNITAKDGCYSNLIEIFKEEYGGKLLNEDKINFCEKISDQKIKDACNNEAAKVQKDLNLCNKIKDQQSKNWCYFKVIVFEKVASKDPAICQNITKYKDDCYTNVAKTTGDVNICNNLDGNDKEKCYIEVAKIIEDKSLCERIETPHQKEWCYISLAEVLKDENLCQKGKDNYSKGQCYLGVAKAKKNPILCEQILYKNVCGGVPHFRDDCYDWFATELKDSKFCDKMECEKGRDICYTKVATNQLNLNLCEKVITKSKKEQCQEYITTRTKLEAAGWKLNDWNKDSFSGISG